MPKYVFMVVNHHTEFAYMNSDTVKHLCDEPVYAVPSLEAPDLVQSNLLREFMDVGASYTSYPYCVIYCSDKLVEAKKHAEVTLPTDFAERLLTTINTSDADMVCYNGRLMTIFDFVRKLDGRGRKSFVVDLNTVLCFG